ncbi:MAG: CRISPR-associated endonuclease Cas1, partial [Candidatus ainarchaeum sp.]|nr:CRISPR-associated endonuclease Cas1 [Candidatus ainarchaeum sp.]
VLLFTFYVLYTRMQIILNEFTSFLGKKGERFIIKTGDKKQEIAIRDVDQILIAAASSISVGAIKLALKNEIDIVFLTGYGKPLGRVFPCKLGGTTLTRKKQTEAYYSQVGAEIAKNLVKGKILNQAYFLKALSKSRTLNFSEVADQNMALAKNIDKLDGLLDDIRDEIFGLEGLAASGYFDCLKALLPFEKRDPEANDEVNILLNYGYGILYSETEKACILAGLDPYFGFLHTDRYNKPSMVLDLIEGFRPIIVDRAIVTLFTQKQVTDKLFEVHFETKQKRLEKSGREKVISAVMERLYTKINYGGKKTTFQDVMLSQARAVSNYLLGKNKNFEPFVYKW